MTDSKKVFISWSGEFGKAIADYLHEDLFKYADLDPWVSRKNINVGSDWFSATKRALAGSHYGVVCLTPGSSIKPWINFETGHLFGRLDNCKLITFDETLGSPLNLLQRMNGLEQEEWIALLADMTGRREEECRSWVETKFPKLQSIVEKRSESPYKYLVDLDQIADSLQQKISELKTNLYAKDNVCFQKVISVSYQEMQSRLVRANKYSIPLSRYPHYLIALQSECHPIVKAVSLVYVEENFWQQENGLEILRTTNSMSSRVFVFTSEKDFTQMNITIRNHAEQYQVYAISLRRLNQEVNLYAKDFSVISTPNGSVLADYDTEREVADFKADSRVIRDHETAFSKIIQLATRIPSGNLNANEVARIRKQVFSTNQLVNYLHKAIEMSAYIDVENYDNHEENHAYYKEMMARMIEIFKSHFPKKKGPFRVLEMGAGTGIFTSRLSAEESIGQIVAIEYDWHCFKTLEYKFRDQRDRVVLLDEDSRTFDPPGKFDCVFTSFADHHIKRQDKPAYFNNIRRNLNPDGIVIVGDEFLREHDSSYREENVKALKAYHSHIIEKAEDMGDSILAELEGEALQSGIDRVGDFKVSCSEYKTLLSESNFSVKQEELIGPTENTEEIGGVYVYVYECKDAE